MTNTSDPTPAGQPGDPSAAPSRATLDKAPNEVATMFDTVADRYEITNGVMSLGLDRIWRRAVVRAVAAVAGERVLDIAAGTGTSTEPFVAAGVHAVPADFSLGMLRVGKRARPALAFTAADAMHLPFADDSFDAVTMSYGLRNVADPAQALSEFLRVTRPGGRVVICEFSSPTLAPVRTAYRQVALRALPMVARRTASNPDSYVYLAESIRAWPTQPELAATMREVGWADVAWRNLTGGIVALHRASKPVATA